ncbi:MAG TPA: hypothetical protein PLF27_07430 [Sedimentibacter sp.]|nr:hypothetical protein [Sedimentibacter sp.]
MKMHIIALVLILLVCGLGITVPYFIKANNEKKLVMEQKTKEEMVLMESSNKDTIIEPENINVELEDYNKEQIYFIGIEVLYDYFTINQVDDIRQRIEFFINYNIDEDIKEAFINKDSITSEDDNIIFSVKAGSNDFEVIVLRSESSIEVNIIVSVKLNRTWYV